jgi:hypothetical protein
MDEKAGDKVRALTEWSRFFGKWYVDDGMLVELLWNLERMYYATRYCTTVHIRMLGAPSNGLPCVVPKKKQTNWSTQEEFLGWMVDTREMTVSLSAKKLGELKELLGWWKDRKKVTARDVWKLTGKLYWCSLAVRTGRYFTRRLIKLTMKKGNRKTVLPTQEIIVGVEAMRDIGMWTWLVEEGGKGEEGKEWVMKAPIAFHVEVPHTRELLSDASHTAIAGYDPSLKIWWRYDLTENQIARLIHGKVGQVKDPDGLHVNLLELVGMVVTAWITVIELGERPEIIGQSIRCLGDNMVSVAQLKKAGGAKNERACSAIRVMAAMEVTSKWSFKSKHIPGKLNVFADKFSRLRREQIAQWLAARGEGEWKEYPLEGTRAEKIITSLLGQGLLVDVWEPLLRADMLEAGNFGASGGSR